MDIVSYAKAKKYTDNSIEGTSGPLAGKNCQIQSVTPIEGGRRITFAWYKDGESVARTTTVDVMNGEKGDIGEDGRGILSASIDSRSHLILHMTDGTDEDAGKMPGGGGGTTNYEDLYNLPSIGGKTLMGDMDLEDIGDVPITDSFIITAVTNAFATP